MLIIDSNTQDINLECFKSKNIVLLSYKFLSIYGLPFCTLFAKKMLKINSSVELALEINNEQASATLAIIDNFPNVIVNPILEYELNLIKKNCCSCSKIFVNKTDLEKAFIA